MPLNVAFNDFRSEMTRLFILDQKTQSQTPSMEKGQLWVINEAIFIRAFRALENFVELAFLHYAGGNPTLSGTAVASYLRPRDDEHAYELIKSSQAFLEWNKPDQVISRAETYLDMGGPIKAVYAGKQALLSSLVRIRNHIAHNSRTSAAQYKKGIQPYVYTLPVTIPSPGEFLQGSFRYQSKQVRLLRHFLDEIADIGQAIAT